MSLRAVRGLFRLSSRRIAFIVSCCGEFEIGASHYFFNDSLLSSRFHHFRGGFGGVDCPFGGSGGVGSFGVSGTDWPFGALDFDWPFRSLGIDWPFGVLGGLRPRDFGIPYLMRAWGLG
jgi:hypothetical protein